MIWLNPLELLSWVIYVESIAVKTDKYSQHILDALELPDFEIDGSSDSGADQKTYDKAVV
jgi:hypothetical protein